MTRPRRRDVVSLPDVDRIEEMFVQVVHELDHAVLACAGDRDEVEHGEVLDHLAQADAAGVRQDRHAELAAISSTARFSLTPPSRHASIWQMPIAPACSSCLNITRFAQCSPVATRTGAIAFAIAAWPRTSSGLVGLFHPPEIDSASACTRAIASPTSHRWLASIISRQSGPISSRTRRMRRRSSSIGPPTLTLKCVQPSASASRHNPRICASDTRTSRPTSCRLIAGLEQLRLARHLGRRVPLEDRERFVRGQDIRDVAKVDARHQLAAGVMRASSFQSGFFSCFA